jgi:D-alanyl-D-alanine carboxypeptidase (penicillin-binding protein 5/6)
VKKLFLILICFLFINVKAETLAPNAKSAILIEASTGEILYEHNSHEKLDPASMTKMMSLLLVMENIEKGVIKWDQIVTVSSNASSMGGSQILLEEGEEMSVEDLIKGIAIASGNDAVVAIRKS